jgi:signal transduction histidine kinase/ActR/RegA family two-component response regulator
VQARVHRELVISLYRTLAHAAVADLVAAWATAWLFYVVEHDAGALAWLALHLAQTLTFPYVTNIRKDPHRGERSEFWGRRYVWNVVRYSAVWGAAPWLFMPSQDLPMAALLVLVVLAICNTGMLSVSPLKPAIWAFCVPMMLGLITALAWQGTLAFVFLAGFVSIFLAVVLNYGFRLHEVLYRSLMTRFEKEALSEQLSEQIRVTERISKEKTSFFAAASHDLRQPLHAIALFGSVLEKELHEQPVARTHAQRLMQAVQALANSLDTMLDISRLDAGVIAASPCALPLNPLFQSLNLLFAASSEAKSLQLRLRASSLWVFSDPELLKRLLSNLIENALKYTPKGGVLVVARQRGQVVWIDVCDTGIGIADNNLSRIFDEFYQVNNPGRERSQGLGIGLSIVRRLSHLLDHPVQVDSRLGRGSRFRVVLPLAAMPAAYAGQAWSPKRPRAPDRQAGSVPYWLPAKVLLLEDEREIGEAMTALLGVHGVRVDWVQTEEQAAAALRQARQSSEPFEALLCDFRLANGGDGLQAGLRLRQTEAGLPLLLITGETAPERLQRVFDSGVKALFKPVAVDELLQALATLCRRTDSLSGV